MKRRLLTLILVTSVLPGCDAIMTQNSPPGHPRAVSLAPEVRRNLQRRFDVDALEEYLGMLAPAEQNEFLSQLGPPRGAREPETRDVSMPMRSTDPARQAVLERVWAPFWDHLPPDALDRADLPFPGRELARVRRGSRSDAQNDRGAP